MPDLLDVTGFESGLASSTLADDEASAVNVGASATLTINASIFRGSLSKYSLQTATGGSSVTSYLERDWGSDQGTVYCECYVQFATVPGAITYFFSLYDSTPAVILDIGVNATGHWIVLNAGDATTYTGTGQALLANQWYRVELKLVSDGAAGTIDLKINGVLEPGASGLTSKNTKPGGSPRRWRAGVTVAQASAGARYIDDLIVRTGGWVGRGYVKKLVMNAMDSGGNNWTITDGGSTDGWQTQDEQPWTSGTTDLIKSSTANQEERITFAPLAQTSTGLTVIGLLPYIRHKRSVAGNAAAVVVDMTSSGSHGATATLDAGNATWTTLRGTPQDTDPATSSAWTLSGVNACVLRMVHDAGTNEGNVNASMVYVAFAATAGQSETACSQGTKGRPARRGQMFIAVEPEGTYRRGRRKHEVGTP